MVKCELTIRLTGRSWSATQFRRLLLVDRFPE